jgi:hypothetical protein
VNSARSGLTSEPEIAKERAEGSASCGNEARISTASSEMGLAVEWLAGGLGPQNFRSRNVEVALYQRFPDIRAPILRTYFGATDSQ